MTGSPAISALWHLLVMLAWVPALVTVHELGHALMASVAGYRVTSFGVGRGRPLLRHRARGGVVLYLGANLLSGGACVAIPRDPAPGSRGALFHAGGVLAQLVLAGVFVALPGWWWVEPVASFNLLVLASNLLPWRVAGMASDGWWILAHLRSRGGSGPGLVGRRRVIGRILQFEERVGSPVGTWYARLMLAWTDVLVGHLDSADRFFAEQHDEAVVDPALDALQQYVEACWHRSRGRPLAALGLIRSVRAARGSELSTRSEDLLALVEARTWLDLTEPGAARKALSQVAGVGGAVGGEAGVVRLEIALAGDDGDEIVRAARRVARDLGGPCLDPPAAVQALSRAVLELERTGREDIDELRGPVQRQALKLLQLAEPEDRSALARRIGTRGPSLGAVTG